MKRLGALQKWALACALLSMVTTSVAHADVRTEARRSFRRGMDLIQQGNVDEGVESLLEAYEILPHPNVLYNIARAYAEANRYEEALDYFDRYLSADPPDRDEVQGFVDALQDRIAAQQAPVQVAETASDTPDEALGPQATDDEIQALEDAATQIATLAQATQSQALEQRAERLRALAQQLREGGSQAGDTVAAGGEGGAGEGGSGQGGASGGGPGEGGALGGGGIEFAEGTTDLYEESVVGSSKFEQSPLDAPNSTQNITRQDVRLTGHTNIGELLRRVGGVDVMTLTPTDVQVGMRGFNQRLSPRLIVLIDGRSTYLDTLGATFWGIIPFGPEDVERIEVIRGPSSAIYGADAFSGIVNIITRPAGEQTNDALFGMGMGGQIHGHLATSGRAGRLGYRVSTGYQQYDRFSREVSDERLADGDFETVWEDPNNALRAMWVNSTLQYRLSEDVNFSVQGALSDNQQNFQGTGPFRDFRARGPNSSIMGSMDTSWGSVRAFWNHTQAFAGPSSNARGGDEGNGRFEANTVDLEATFHREFHLGVDHNLHVGLSYRWKDIFWEFLVDDQQENHYAAFAQDTMRIIEQLIVVGSFRVDFHPLLSSPVFSPRGAVIIKPTETQAIRASVGTAFRTQTFLESYLQLQAPTPVAGVGALALGSETLPAFDPSAPELKPENILSVEVGYRNAASEYFDWEISAYYNRITNIVNLGQIDNFRLSEFGAGFAPIYDDGSSTFTLGTLSFENDPTDFDVVGGEASLRVYPVTGLDIYFNYAFNDTFVSCDQPPCRREDRTSMHKVNLGVQYRSSFGLDLSVDLHWVSDQVWPEQVFDVDEGVKFDQFKLDGYHMLNARVGYRLFDDALELGVVGYNITNNQHRQHPFGQRLDARVMGTVAYHF